MIIDYYKDKFREHLVAFLPNPKYPYFGHNWYHGCDNLSVIPTEYRAKFLICLYFTILVDQAMYTHYRCDYKYFENLTRYPKFCHGLNQFQKNPSDILLFPCDNGMVKKEEIEKILLSGMELFVYEVKDFFNNYMKHINPEEFFEKLIYDPDVQIPLILLVSDPKMKTDIVYEAYQALCASVEKIFNQNK